MHVLIVDNALPIIERLKEILSETNIIRAIYIAVCYEDVINLFNKIQPDAVLLDFNLPDNQSLKILRAIKKIGCKTFIIALAVDKSDYQNNAGAMGANLILDKYYEFEKIPAVIEAVASGNYQVVFYHGENQINEPKTNI